MSMSELLTTSQAAEVIGVSRGTVHRMIEAGEISPTARIAVAKSGSFVFTPAEVARVAEGRLAAIRAKADKLRAQADALEAKANAK